MTLRKYATGEVLGDDIEYGHSLPGVDEEDDDVDLYESDDESAD